MNLERLKFFANKIVSGAGPLETVVVASVNVNGGEMIRLSSRPCGPAIAILARSLLVDALEMMEEASDDASMELANGIEAAIGCLPPYEGDEESDDL